MSQQAKADFSRRSFLEHGRGRRGCRRASAPTKPARKARPAQWDQTADVVIVGAGVAGLPAAITARDLGASVIVVEENYDIGGRGMLSGGRVQLGGGHALQQKFNIKDNADQVFLDWVRADDAESRYSDRDLVRVYADENVATYQFLLDNGVEFIEKPIGPVDAIDAAAHLRHQGMAHPGRGGSAASQPQRLGAGAAIGRERAQEGRADSAQAQDDADRPRAADERQGARHRGEGGRQDHQHPRHEGRHHRDRRPHRQRRLPPHVRSAADGGIPAGLPALRLSERRRRDRGDGHRRIAVGDRDPDHRERRGDHQDTPHRLPLGLCVAGVRDRQPDVPAGESDRPDGEGLAGHHHGQPVRPAVLGRGRRQLQVLQRRDGLQRRQDQAQRRRARSGRSSTPTARRARSGTPSRRTSIRMAFSSAPTRSASSPARSRCNTRSSRCRARR